MNQTSEPATDKNGKEIVVGAIVAIHGTSFDHHAGIVMDIASDMEPEDGPIAVFFDWEVDRWNFTNSFEASRWKGTKPTPENYKEHPRTVCFLPGELTVEDGFPLKTRALRLYGDDGWHSASTLPFPLVPNTHPCHFADCKDGIATEKTLVNFWGTVYEVYACAECHVKRNGACTEVLDLKRPLPGAPAE